MHENEISGMVLDAAIEVHRVLGGPGLLENVYEEALAWELAQRGVQVERQINVPVVYKQHVLATPLRLDLWIERLVIIEVKATTEYNKIFEVQARTYLRLTNCKLAVVINFGEEFVKNGFHRVANHL